VNFSMMSYSMRRNRRVDIESMLRLTRELDLAGVDFVTLHGHRAEDLRRRADDHGVRVICYTFHADLNHPDPEGRKPGIEIFRRGIEAAQILGAPLVMLIAPGRADLSPAASRRNWIAGLREALPIAQAAGITLTLENFAGHASPFLVADDMLEAVGALPDLRLTCDFGNAATGEDPVASYRRVAEHVVHVHLKDWTIRSRRLWRRRFRRMRDGRYYRPAVIGEGDLDLRACLETGYDRCIDVECESRRYPPEEAVRRAVATLRALEADLER